MDTTEHNYIYIYLIADYNILKTATSFKLSLCFLFVPLRPAEGFTDFSHFDENIPSQTFSACVSAEISLVMCDREEKAAALLENKEKGETPKLSCLVLFNEFSQAFLERAKTCQVEVLKLEQLMVSTEEVPSFITLTHLKCIPL